jgi:hypothetical protein
MTGSDIKRVAAAVSRDHWAVTVWRNGEEIVTIETDCLSGKEIGPADEEAIRTAAQNLRAFIGDHPCFPPSSAART